MSSWPSLPDNKEPTYLTGTARYRLIRGVIVRSPGFWRIVSAATVRPLCASQGATDS